MITAPENWNLPQEWIADRDIYCSHIPFPSSTTPGLFYNIRFDHETRELTCDCPGFKYRKDCSHIRKLCWITKLKGRSTRTISMEAFKSLEEEVLSAMKKRLLALLAEVPHTCEELETITGIKHQTLSPRLLELCRDGFIENSGAEQFTASGRKAIVWKVA